MKINVSYPKTALQKTFEIEDELKLRPFFDKRMATEVDADSLGGEWAGYRVRISGGNDKQGFPMKQGVLTNKRVRLLLRKGASCYRPRRKGERKRKSVRGCIVDSNLSVLSLVIVRVGDAAIPGLTDGEAPRMRGPKRASRIRKAFLLGKKDDVRPYVVEHKLPANDEKKLKERIKRPKIQRLVTPLVLQRKRHRVALKRRRAAKKREDAAKYSELLAKRLKEMRDKRHERKRTRSASVREGEGEAPSSGGPAAPKRPRKEAAAAASGDKPAAKKAGEKTKKSAGGAGAAKKAKK